MTKLLENSVPIIKRIAPLWYVGEMNSGVLFRNIDVYENKNSNDSGNLDANGRR